MAPFSLKIALRYFFSKSTQTVINRINGFAFFMVVIATASLFVVLSAFGGLKDFGLSFSESFDPDYQIQPQQGKFFYVSDSVLTTLSTIKGVIAAAPQIEEKVFLSYNEKNQVAYLKAVDQNYSSVVPIEDLITLGDWLSFDGADVVLGFGLAGNLGVGVYDYTTFLNLTVPKKKKQSLLNQSPFNQVSSIVVGLYQGELTEALTPLFDTPIKIVSRAEQNAALYKMLNIEQLAIYFIFSLVMLIALFNVVGALIMMILDKQRQMKILLSMGATPQRIHRVFFLLGVLICSIGGLIGLVLGSVLVLVQYHFPFIYVPGTNLSYPVLYQAENLLIVITTLMVLGLLSTAWATRGLDKKITHYTG